MNSQEKAGEVTDSAAWRRYWSCVFRVAQGSPREGGCRVGLRHRGAKSRVYS